MRTRSRGLRYSAGLVLVGVLAGTFVLYSLGTRIDERRVEIRRVVRTQDHPVHPASGPLRVDPRNPRYFQDGTGKPVVLVGSHTWANLVDNGLGDPPPVFDYPAYLDMLVAYNHNCFRLWAWEQACWAPWVANTDYCYSPGPYRRTGPGTALDGKPKFDLDAFDEAYFERVRQRVKEAGDRGIYVSIMLFNGWSVEPKVHVGNPWLGHPFNKANNINGVDGDPDGDESGAETHQLVVPAVTVRQESYVRKIIETVNDLDNVLYEISNESRLDSLAWQYHMIDLIHRHEAALPKQHPVGMTSFEGLGRATNAELFASAADWISPNNGVQNEYATDPPEASGAKVVILDTDHIWGIGGDRTWAWKAFLRGYNVLFMDAFDGAAVGSGAPAPWDVYPATWSAILKKGLKDVLGRSHRSEAWNPNGEAWVSLRENLGYIQRYAQRLDLAHMIPRGDISSTGFCLASASPDVAPSYLVYHPGSGDRVSIDLSEAHGTLDVEWLDPETGDVLDDRPVEGGGTVTFQVPFEGDAVLYISTRR